MNAGLDALMARLTGYRMTRWEKRAQAISFAAYNVLIDRPEYDPWMCLLWAAKAHDDKHGQWGGGRA